MNVNADEAMKIIRLVVNLAGTVIIAAALAKWFGFNGIPLRGEPWQMALIGMACRQL